MSEDNSEVNVDRLMEKIREEVAKRSRQISYDKEPVTVISEKQNSNIPSIKSIITSAETHADVGATVPQMVRFHGIARKFALFAGKWIVYLSSFITYEQRLFNRAILDVLKSITDALENTDSQMARSNQNFARALGTRNNQMAELNKSFTGALESRDNQMEELHKNLNQALKNKDDQIRELREAINLLKSGLLMQERRISVLLEEIRKGLGKPEVINQLNDLSENDNHFIDALYVSFEDQFRGTREEIKEKERVYLPYIRKSNAVIKNSLTLDLGCGRGEWLELLKEEGIYARGVDMNSVLVKQCRERELEVIENEVMAYLKSLPDSSLGAATGFHIIEHLPFGSLVPLLDEIVRTLKSGGIAILETPNPQNITVGACNFYTDPSHIKPFHPTTLSFLAEARGLCNVEIIYLHPFSQQYHLPVPSEKDENGNVLRTVVNRFNEIFYSAQDFAVIGWKA